MKVLLVLAYANGQAVSREEMMETVWPDRIVNTDALNNAISKLRQTFRKNNAELTVIKTVPKVGYRLVLEVQLQPTPTNTLVAIKDNNRIKPSVILSFCFIAIIGMLFWQFQPKTTNQKNPLRITPVAINPGKERFPKFSPNGKYLVLQTNINDQWQLSLKDLQTEQVSQITHFDDIDAAPEAAWSFDSKSLVFTRYYGKNCHIYQYFIETQSLEIVTTCSATSNVGVSFAQNDKGIYFSMRPKLSEAHQIYYYDFEGKYLAEVTKPAALEYDFGPHISPNGDKLAFFRISQKRPSLYVLDLNSTQLEHYPTEGNIVDITWTPKNEIVYLSNQKGQYDFWKIDDSKQSEWIGIPDFKAISVDINLATGAIAYTRTYERNFIAKIDLSNGQTQQISSDASINWLPKLSPDNKKIVYLSTRTGTGQLWMYDKEKKTERQLTQSDSYTLTEPSWSPDSKSVVYTTSIFNNSKLCIVQINSSEIDCVIEDESAKRFPMFSNDNHSVIYTSNKEGIWKGFRYNLETKKLEELPLLNPIKIVESKHSSTLLYARKGEGSIWEFDPIAKKHRQLIFNMASNHIHSWTQSSQALFYVNERHQLFRFDFKSETKKFITALSKFHFQSGLSISGDESYLITSIEQDYLTEVMLTNATD